MALSLFSDQTAKWFRETLGFPTAVQEESWPAIASGRHTLISAPTGTGKTLSAFLLFIDRLARLPALEDKLYVIYISPLKALGNDIRENLKRPIEGLRRPDIRTAIRSGDTTPAQRRQMLKRPPHILITTPESLYLLLSSTSGRGMLKTAETVIVDELHALIGGKRGAHMMLSLARLDALCGHPLQRIGLSATIKPLSRAARYLSTGEVAIVAPPMEKSSDIIVTSPVPDMRMLPNNTIWPEVASAVYDACMRAHTVIAFVDGRAQAEKLAFMVNEIAGEGFARTHHGCVSKEQRLEAEQQLKSGQLRLLCATSSMELGIDVGDVDLVLQLGAPPTVAGALQRLGRAGHNPGRLSLMRIYPKTAADALACGLVAKTALEGDIEPVQPPRRCLDVLAQHLVSMAAVTSYTVDSAWEIVSSLDSFRDVTREDIRDVLRMLAGDFEHDRDIPVRPRLLYDRIHDTVSGDSYSRLLAVSSGGTIPDRGWYPVMLEDGTRLGELDEEFVFEARIGDKFLLGSFAWRIREIRRDRVVVTTVSPEGAQPPFWRGDAQGRDYQTALRFGRQLRRLTEACQTDKLRAALIDMHLDQAAAFNAERYIVSQVEAAGCLPDDRTMILEHFTDEAGEHQLMIHSIFGRRVNWALEMLLQREAANQTGLDVRSFCEDDGLLLFLIGVRDIPDGLLQVLDPDTAAETVRAMLPGTPLFSMAFRYNAARALMLGMRNGSRQPLWVQRLRGAETLGAATHQSEHPLMAETLRECCEDFLDLRALREVLMGIRSGSIRVLERHVEAPSPMALPLRRQVEMEMMYDYNPIPSAAKKAVEENLARQEGIAPDPQLLAQTARQEAAPPTDVERLHARLMAEGDLVAGEIEVPLAWLEALARADRAMYIDPGLWICAEQAELYESALVGREEEALSRLCRRCLRYRGAQDAQTLVERYQLPEALGADILARLQEEGLAVEQDGWFYHRQIYDKARRETIQSRRREAETCEPERFAALLTAATRQAGSALEQLRQGLRPLAGLALPIEWWEGAVLPARTTGYRPRLLDELLSRGEWAFRVLPGERTQLAFERIADVDWNAPLDFSAAPLDEAERAAIETLARRGASFAHTLSPLPGNVVPSDVLARLCLRGLVRADSFLPIRQAILAQSARPVAPKRLSRARAAAQSTGRWELQRPLMEQTFEAQLERLFDRYGILCRETAEGLDWRQALEVLRVWEYTGRARRGYYIRGLSGAQFMRADDYPRLQASLAHPDDEALWLNAVDPMQPWGKLLAHREGADFLRVPGTLVALRAGAVAAVLERQGETLRSIRPDDLEAVCQALGRDFAARRVYPALDRLTIKKYPPEAAPALEAAGFTREASDYLLWRGDA